MPVALVWGEQDRLMHIRIAERASAAYGWPLHRIEACGHGPQIEWPERLGGILETILAS